MDYSQFFFTLFCMVSFCLGLNKIMEKGNILYFLRKPFEDIYDLIERKESILKAGGYTNKFLQSEIKLLRIKYYIAKPLVLCITCFASIWGGAIFISLNGISLDNAVHLLISCVSSSYIQTVIYAKMDI